MRLCEICQKIKGAYSRLDEVYFALDSSVEGVLGWKDQEMVVVASDLPGRMMKTVEKNSARRRGAYSLGVFNNCQFPRVTFTR